MEELGAAVAAGLLPHRDALAGLAGAAMELEAELAEAATARVQIKLPSKDSCHDAVVGGGGRGGICGG